MGARRLIGFQPQGVKGVASQDDVAAGRVVVLAPDGFMDAATSENVFAGTAMSRRIIQIYGRPLRPGHAVGFARLA
jgi:alkyl sulfatase BDS1-like metallo-beta-lactamase superfamily hydrolase